MWLDGRFGAEQLELQVATPYVLQDIRQVSFANGVDERNNPLFEEVGEQRIELLNRRHYPKRQGMGDLLVGLHATFLSLDPAKAQPDFRVRAQYTAPTAPVMKRDNTEVGEGLHQILVGVEAGYAVSQGVQAHLDLSAKARLAADQELYITGFRTQHLQHPGSQARAATTVTITPWSSGNKARFMTISLGGDVLFTAAGREPSLLFDALSNSKCSEKDLAGGYLCEATKYRVPTTLPLTARGDTSNGVTDVQEHLRLGGKMEIRYRPSEHIEIVAGTRVAFTPAHFLTFARLGMDVDNSGELDNVDATYNESEYNPVYIEALDKPGNRLLASGILEVSGFFSTAYLF